MTQNDESLPFDIQALSALFGGLGGQLDMQVKAIAAECSELISKFGKFDPVSLAATFSGLLTVPALQSHCLRLECLVHLSLAYSGGSHKPTEQFINSCFKTLGNGVAGRAEDPSEDLFVSSVKTPRGNFRLLGGIWEGPGFFLQRYLDALEKMPNSSFYNELRDDVYALLAVSDLICERTGLEPHQLGGKTKSAGLNRQQLEALPRRRGAVRVSEAELEAKGISASNIAPFLFQPNEKSTLLESNIGNSPLERRPMLRSGGSFYLILPTAVTTAIRYHITAHLTRTGQTASLAAGIANEYLKLFRQTRMLGGPLGTGFEFREQPCGFFADALFEVDIGRWLHVVLATDKLKDFEETGLAGINPDSALMAPTLGRYVRDAHARASATSSFVDGYTVFVSCGVGRGAGLMLEDNAPPNWRVEFTPAHDFETLSWADKVKPLTLWRLRSAEEKLSQEGAELFNVNGLINLVAWARSQDGHLVEHGSLPDNFMPANGRGMFIVDQTSLRDLRHEVAVEQDTQMARDVDGLWKSIRKASSSMFDDDRAAPLYATDSMQYLPQHVFITEKRSWWGHLITPDEASADYSYQRFNTIGVWLSRAAPHFERLVGLPDGPILWSCRFPGPVSFDPNSHETYTYEQARAAISVQVGKQRKEIITFAVDGFERAVFHGENIAERALIATLIDGISELMAAPLSDRDKETLLNKIVPNPQVRHSHAFQSRGFRDEVRADMQDDPVLIDLFDQATLNIGQGWRVRSRSDGPLLNGKSECIGFLNDVVRVLQEDIIASLRRFERRAMIDALLRNHENAASDRDRWKRTAAAVLALHADREATLQKMAEHDFKLNAVFQCSRNLIEIAICECPFGSGAIPGKLDISVLMAQVSQLFSYGGWSDAIRWDAMEPKLRVTPLGDIQTNHEFFDQVITPHARVANDSRVETAAEGYEESLKVQAPTDAKLEPDFEAAWLEEYGATFEETRFFFDYLEAIGVDQGKAVIEVPQSRLVNATLGERRLTLPVVVNLLSALTLAHRGKWSDTPNGFEDRDRHLWRYRRRLSILRRPLLKIDDRPDPTFMVAPGLAREAFGYCLGNFHRGDFPTYQLKPKMKAWAAREADRRGALFSREVENKLSQLGWRTMREIKVTRLLGQGFQRDFGDVDVLAWRPDQGRVLIIECKDVQYRKTPGEMAEQVADFRGGLRDTGKPDYLKKHLDRIELIREHLSAAGSFLGMDQLTDVESHLLFRNPVPMEFALKNMTDQVIVSTFGKIENI